MVSLLALHEGARMKPELPAPAVAREKSAAIPRPLDTVFQSPQGLNDCLRVALTPSH